ncbi:MAG: sugar phosphate isomerase/epimerase [Clostridia bacterium]|nr:sugar phosphate isomerase/epimerase [Clostridia bacterium]
MKIGLQLYSVREALGSDLPGTLRAVKNMGYDYVELAGGRYGLSGGEMRLALSEAGLQCISVHSSPTLFSEDREDVLSYVKAIGASYSVIPIPAGRLDAFSQHWDETLGLFGEMASFFADADVQLLYHNHDFEFTPLGNELVIHRLLRVLPALFPEPDLCWISYGGEEPASFLRRYAGRVPVVHLKDYNLSKLPSKPIHELLSEGYEKPEKRSLAGFSYAPVGFGVLDWEESVSACREAGAEYLVVEQDSSPDPLEDAAKSRSFLKERFGL